MGALYRLIRLKKTPVGKDCQISCQVSMEHLFLESEIQVFHAHQVIFFSQARRLRFI